MLNGLDRYEDSLLFGREKNIKREKEKLKEKEREHEKRRALFFCNVKFPHKVAERSQKRNYLQLLQAKFLGPLKRGQKTLCYATLKSKAKICSANQYQKRHFGQMAADDRGISKDNASCPHQNSSCFIFQIPKIVNEKKR